MAVVITNFVPSALRRNGDNSSNYNLWKEQMKCLLESQNLFDYVNSADRPQLQDAAARQTDHRIRGWILGALSDSVAETVVNFDSAWDVWRELKNNFSTPSRAAPPPEPDWHMNLPIYKAALNGEWGKMQEILNRDPKATRARVDSTLETALQVAVGGGRSKSFVDKLVKAMSHDSLAIRDKLGFNVLHVAAWTGNLPAAKLLVGTLPDMLYVANGEDELPVHLAAYSGHREVVDFLMSRTDPNDMRITNGFRGESGSKLLAYLMDSDYFDLAVNLVNMCPELATRSRQHGRPALSHIALRGLALSSNTQLNFWQRFKRYLPGTGGKKGYDKKVMRQDALRLVKCLCRHMEHLTYTEAEKIYGPAMVTAAKMGAAEVIRAIVETFPTAIYSKEASTNRNFLHLAVKNRRQAVFSLIYQTGNHRYRYSNEVDTRGNSIVHLAAMLAPPKILNKVSGAALQMQREYQWFKEAQDFISPHHENRTNKAGKTAQTVFTEEHKDLKKEGEKWMKDTATACSIATALIMTIVFTAAITVPGDYDAGKPKLHGKPAFIVFAISDAISLFSSTTSLIMFLSILTSRFAEKDFLFHLPNRLFIGLLTIFISILCMMTAFSATLYLVFGDNKALTLIPVAALAAIPIVFFLLFQHPLLRAVYSSTYGNGIFRKKKSDRRPFH